jgi:hypothetical protein
VGKYFRAGRITDGSTVNALYKLDKNTHSEYATTVTRTSLSVTSSYVIACLVINETECVYCALLTEPLNTI